jgi:hypothetical protein
LQRAARRACQGFLPEHHDATPLRTALSDARARKAEARRFAF